MQRRSNSTACHHLGQRRNVTRGLWALGPWASWLSSPLLIVLILGCCIPTQGKAQTPTHSFSGAEDILSLPSIGPIMPPRPAVDAIAIPTALWRGWSCLLLDPKNRSQPSDVILHGQEACQSVESILGDGATDPATLALYAQESLMGFGYISQAEALADLSTMSPARRSAFIDAYRLLWVVEDMLATRDKTSEGAARRGLEAAEALGSDLLRAEFNDRLAIALTFQNEWNQAKDHFALAGLYAQLAHSPYILRRTESNEAALLTRRQGDQEAVQAAFLRFLEARLAAKDLPGIAVSLRKLATRNYNADNLLDAAAQARDSVTIARFLGDELLTGKALTILGHTLDELGDTPGCRAAYRQALELLPTTPNYVRYWINAFSAQLQFELSLLEDHDNPTRDSELEALTAQATRALSFADAMSQEQLLELHLNRSRLALAQQNPEDAALALETAQGIATEETLRNWSIELSFQRGRVALAQGRLIQAKAAFEATCYEADLQGQLAAQWRALNGLASIHFAQDDRESALESLGDAASVVERLWAAVDDGGEGESAGAGARFLEGQIDIYDRAVEALLLDSPGDEERLQAWWWSERRRTGALRRQLGTRTEEDLAFNSQALAEQWLGQVQSQLLRLEDRGTPSILISYQVSQRSAWAFVITGDALIVRSLPLNGSELDRAIDEAFPFLQAQNEAQRQLGVHTPGLGPLAKALWAPIADLVPRGALLRIIPDGRLALLPFEILPLSNDPKAAPLLTQHALVYGTSSRELIGKESRALLEDASLLSLAIGQAIPATSTHGALPPLPCAREEGERLRSGPQDVIYLNDEASESRFVNEAHEFDILHVAVHGVIAENRFHRSHLVLSPDEWADGLLTLPEIAGLDLKARLAILPACQSAVARIFRGEGAQGVGSAFREAGVASTAVGLWELHDVVGTVEINHRMVSYLRQGMGSAEALRLSKLDVMKAGATPRTWAPLVLYGSAEAIFKAPQGPIPLPSLGGDMNGACQDTLWNEVKGWFDWHRP